MTDEELQKEIDAIDFGLIDHLMDKYLDYEGDRYKWNVPGLYEELREFYPVLENDKAFDLFYCEIIEHILKFMDGIIKQGRFSNEKESRLTDIRNRVEIMLNDAKDAIGKGGKE